MPLPPEDHDVSAAEDLLVRLRADLEPAARDRLERRLLGRPARRRGRVAAAGLALAGGLAVLVLALVAIGGGLPGKQDVVLADPECGYVARDVRVQQPFTVTTPSGATTVETRTTTVTRLVRDCR